MNIRDSVIAVFARSFGINPSSVPPVASMDSLPEWDSFKHLMLLSEVEAAIQVEFDPEDIVRVRTLEQLITLAERCTGYSEG